MKKLAKNRPIPLRKLIFWVMILLIASGIIVFALEKLHVTNIYTKPAAPSSQDQNSATKPANSVDYSPATSTEKPTTNQKSQDTTSTKTNNSTQSIYITLSAAGQDAAGGPILVRTILEGATGGSCSIVIAKSGNSKTYSAPITWQGTYYSCNYNIPYADLSVGNWQLSITAKQDTKQGTATAAVAVK